MLSYDDTFEYKLLAAKKGDRTALVRLGLTYFRNRIMPPDIQATERLLRDAANTGDADAQCSLGLFCHFGIGMDRNESEAVKWFQKASAQGHADAQHRLGCAFDRLI